LKKKNQSYRHWTDKEVLTIREMKNTMTAREIAKKLGFSTIQVNHALHRYKLQPPKLGFFARTKRFISYLFS
jgi:hypothetical protein